jgi:hypothetical protein
MHADEVICRKARVSGETPTAVRAVGDESQKSPTGAALSLDQTMLQDMRPHCMMPVRKRQMVAYFARPYVSGERSTQSR